MSKRVNRPTVYRMMLAVVTTIFYISNIYGQNKQILIENVKSEFQHINADKTLRVLKLENEDIPGPTLDNGKSLTAFYKGKTIYKIQISAGLSFGIKEYKFYFKNDELFFVYEKENDFPYNKNKGTLDQSKTEVAFEARYYLYKNKIIEVKRSGKKRFEERPVISNKDLMSMAKEYVDILKPRLK